MDDAFCKSLSVPVGVNGDSVQLFISSWIALLSDSPLEPEKKPFRLYVKFLNRIKTDGLKAVVTGFSELAHRLVSQHHLVGSQNPHGDWIAEFKNTPVFFEYIRYYKSGDVNVLRFLYTFLNFGKKLDYVDEAFNEAAFRGWIDIEKKLADWSYDAEDLSALRAIIQSLLPPFSWRDLRPKFGPGSVQERGVRTRIDKIRHLQYDRLIDRFILHGHLGKYGDGDELGLSASRVLPDPSRWTPDSGVSSRIARLRFVPKNLKVARSICMEPNTLMYFQQAAMARTLELIGESLLSNFIDIKDQSRNRELACAGSFTGEVDTLDLSSASDSVSVQLVKEIFPASWKLMMLVTRSHSAFLPNGLTHRLWKFAPMGSALCFPTQCIIFASVCIYAACRHTYEVEHVQCDFLSWLTPDVIKRVCLSFGKRVEWRRSGYQPLAVYGDDIIVDQKLTSLVTSILSRLGFIVNEEKSFVGSQSFRESCGGFYLNGHDITPLYFRVKGVRRTLSAEHVASHVSLLNASRERGYFNTHSFLLRTLLRWECPKRYKNRASGKLAIPFVSDPQQWGVYRENPGNKHLASRRNSDLQRTEYRILTVSYDSRIFGEDLLASIDAYEYMRWWSGRSEVETSAVHKAVPRYDTGSPGLRDRKSVV